MTKTNTVFGFWNLSFVWNLEFGISLRSKAMTDPIADMLIRIKNAQAVKKETVKIPFSAVKFSIAQILVHEGFLGSAERKGRGVKRYIECTLRYHHGLPAMENVQRVSVPSRRLYLPASRIRSPKGGYGIAIVSTSKGLMTDREARKQKMGGEVMCLVW